LALVGLWSLWRQRAEGRAALAEDLKAVVFAEESHRARGRFEPGLLTAEVPPGWQRAYRRSFEMPQSSEGLNPPAVSLASIDDFDGRCALVTLANAPHDPVRAYCLTGTGWQRTPVSPAAWGDESELAPLAGLRLRFRERDRAFAERLAADLAGLAGRLPLAGLEIVLEPHDLAGPLILVEANRLILNSPELVPTWWQTEAPEAAVVVSPKILIAPAWANPVAAAEQSAITGWVGALSGPEAVRLALGRILVSRAGLSQPPPASRLPGVDRFIAAAQTVTAMHLLLSPETQARLREDWRAKLAGRWLSPFFAGHLSAGQAKTAALLTADYITQRHGPETLPHLLAGLPQAISWDEIFGELQQRIQQRIEERSEGESRRSALAGGLEQDQQRIEKRSEGGDLPAAPPAAPEQSYATLWLEIKVAYYAGADRAVIAGLTRAYNRPIDRPPLAAKLRYLDNHNPGQPGRLSSPRFFLNPAGILFNWPYDDDRLQGWRLYASRPGQPEPLLIETGPGLALTTPDGLPLSPGCLGPGADLSIEGDWLEAPRRFQARQITVQRAPRLSPRPARSLAYLVVQTGLETEPASQLVALGADGSYRPLLDLTPRLQLFPLPVAGDEPLRLLARSDAPACSRSWFGLYEPGRGITAHWFAPAGPVEWLWRSDRAELLFVKATSNSRYQFYKAGGAELFQWQNFSPYGFSFLGWQPANRRLVTIGYHTDGLMLGLLDPANGRLTWLANPPPYAIRPQGFSPAGDWLAYPTGLPSLFGPSGRVYLLNLERPALPAAAGGRSQPGRPGLVALPGSNRPGPAGRPAGAG
jgi:hypothetical protein